MEVTVPYALHGGQPGNRAHGSYGKTPMQQGLRYWKGRVLTEDT